MNAHLDTGIVYHGCLPLLVEKLDALPPEHELLHINESNELLLKTVSVLEDKPEHDETDPLSHELKRQDLKLSLLLDMLGSLLVQYKILPQPQQVELTSDTLTIQSSEAFSGQQACRICIYIESNIPKPLILFASSQDTSAPGEVSFALTGVGQNVQDNLDKFIFRHHRRRVAQTRKA